MRGGTRPNGRVRAGTEPRRVPLGARGDPEQAAPPQAGGLERRRGRQSEGRIRGLRITS